MLAQQIDFVDLFKLTFSLHCSFHRSNILISFWSLWIEFFFTTFPLLCCPKQNHLAVNHPWNSSFCYGPRSLKEQPYEYGYFCRNSCSSSPQREKDILSIWSTASSTCTLMENALVILPRGQQEGRGTAVGHLPLNCRYLGLKQAIRLSLKCSRTWVFRFQMSAWTDSELHQGSAYFLP